MSYILDALRRADAERERGTVPSLHTQQFGSLPSDDEAAPRPRLLIGAIVMLALALAGVVAWLFLGGSEPPKPAVQVATAPAVVPPPPAIAPPLPATPSPPVASAPAVTPPTGSATKPPATRPASSSPAATMTPRPASRPAPRRDSAPARSASPAPTAALPTAEDRIYSLSELPEGVRRELPKIAYGGGSYSPDKASRLAFLNGQVFHEGDTIAPGLELKQVKQKGAILAYKGYRFEIGP